MKTCLYCGKVIFDNERFCPYCGKALDVTINQEFSTFNSYKPSSSKSKNVIIIVGAITVLLIVLFVLSFFSKVDVDIKDNHVYMGYESYNLDYSGNGLKWTSSDTSVAKVNDNGEVIGCGEGVATITAKSRFGKEDSVDVTVATLVDEWEWQASQSNGEYVYSSDFEFPVEVNGEYFSLKAGTSTFSGKWEYVSNDDEMVMYRFSSDGISMVIIIYKVDNLMMVFPEEGYDMSFFYTRK